MEKDEYRELQSLIEKHCFENNITLPEILAFFELTFLGSMEKHGYSIECFDQTCERMKVNFREKRKAREK